MNVVKDKPKALDSTEKYVFIIEQSIERVIRINKETKEKFTI